MNCYHLQEKKYLDAAIHIGYKLIAESIIYEDCCNWQSYTVHPVYPEKKIPTLVNLSGAFYEGLSGIAFFMGFLYKETKQEDFKITAYSILNTIEKQHFYEHRKGSLSLYSGAEGMIFVLYHLSVLLNDDSLKDKALSLLQSAVNTTLTGVPDIISGAPGILPFLININKLEKIAGLSMLIERIGQHIINTAHPTSKGISWETIKDAEHLLGYAHGTAGFVHALTELYENTHNNLFLTMAMEAIRYEDSYFNPTYKNWPDLRKDENNRNGGYMSAWCHGAPGILLSRIKLYSITKNQSLLPIMQSSTEELIINNTQNMQAMSSYCLCHGVAGNAEVFIQLYKQLGDEDALKEVKRIADFGIERYINNDLSFPSGSIQQKSNPTLLLGDAGVGLFYLRVFNTMNQSPLFITANDIS